MNRRERLMLAECEHLTSRLIVTLGKLAGRPNNGATLVVAVRRHVDTYCETVYRVLEAFESSQRSRAARSNRT